MEVGNICFVLMLFSALIENLESLQLSYQEPTAEKPYLQFLCTATKTVAMMGVTKNGEMIAKYDVKTKKKTKTEDFATVNYYSGTKLLELKYPKPDCNQYGKYQCVADGTVSTDFTYGGGGIFPTDLELAVDPAKSSFGEQETITVTCSGKVGNPPKEWSWNTRIMSDNSTTDWESYTDGIKSQERQKLSGCQFQQTTALTYTVKNADDGRQFQCTLGGSFSKSFEIKLNSGSTKLENLIPIYFLAAIFILS